MRYLSYTELRRNLKKHLDSVCESRAPLVVTRQSGESVVMLSLAEYESLEEALTRLMRSVSCSPSRRPRSGAWSNMICTNESQAALSLRPPAIPPRSHGRRSGRDHAAFHPTRRKG